MERNRQQRSKSANGRAPFSHLNLLPLASGIMTASVARRMPNYSVLGKRLTRFVF